MKAIGLGSVRVLSFGLIWAFVFFILGIFFWWLSGCFTGGIVGIAVGFFFLFFYRVPRRDIPDDPFLILSAADGKVVSITEVDDDFVGRAVRVSVFMSLLNVHINRSPLAAEVVESFHRFGEFVMANSERASIENEQHHILLKSERGSVRIVQVAGMLARRIVSTVVLGQHLTAGETIGFIHFGSRVDHYLPADVELTVEVGDRVYAGKGVIARWR